MACSRRQGLVSQRQAPPRRRPGDGGTTGKSWYRKGKRHREEGPAVEHADGKKEWYRHGKELSASEFAAIREKELAEIGDAFKTGLAGKITVSRPRQLKSSREKEIAEIGDAFKAGLPREITVSRPRPLKNTS